MAVERFAVADAHRADGVAVIGAFEGDELLPFPPARGAASTESGELQRDFNRRRSGVRVEDARETAGSNLYKFLGKNRGGCIHKT